MAKLKTDEPEAIEAPIYWLGTLYREQGLILHVDM
jgi:hypothetical protein